MRQTIHAGKKEAMIEIEGARLHPVHSRHATVMPKSRSLVIAFGHPVFVVWSRGASFVTDSPSRIQAGLLPERVESGRTQRRAGPARAVFLPSLHRLDF